MRSVSRRGDVGINHFRHHSSGDYHWEMTAHLHKTEELNMPFLVFHFLPTMKPNKLIYADQCNTLRLYTWDVLNYSIALHSTLFSRSASFCKTVQNRQTTATTTDAEKRKILNKQKLITEKTFHEKGPNLGQPLIHNIPKAKLHSLPYTTSTR